ncbi:MAG: preprotein translocase subunit SecE [Blautia sp.]|jgi:preprotein translocase subunit SecE
MADSEKTTGTVQKKSWFQGVKSEFNKIIWTDRKTLVKQTIAVVVISIVLGVIISLLDSGILAGINLLLK